MTQYIVRAADRDAILAKTGSREFLLHTTHKRHAAVGERFTLRAGRSAPPFATALCTYRARLILSADGLHRVLEAQMLPDGEPLAMTLNAAENGCPNAARYQHQLAVALGHPHWGALIAHETEHGGADPEDNRLWREVVGFTDVQPVTAPEAV